MYMTMYVANIAVLITANVPIFETCSMYDDPDGCWTRYLFYLGLYMVFAISATLKGTAKSPFIQMFTTVSRVVLIALLTAVCAHAMMLDVKIWKEPEAAVYVERNIIQRIFIALPALIDGSSTFLVFPMIFGECYKKDRMTLTYVITVSCFIVMGVVAVVGVIVGVGLDSATIPEMSTLSFQGYAFGAEQQNVFHQVLERVIVTLPGFLVIVSGPMVAGTLSDNF